MNNKTVIDLKDLTRVYKRGAEEVHALRGLSFTVEEGEFLSIVGPSGSGKTTLLNIIGCLDNPDRGTVEIDGRDISKIKQSALAKIRREVIGFVFQQFFLIPSLTAWENVQIPGLFAKNRKKAERAKELLSMVGLDKRANHLPAQLSGGEMQRVAIARALINSPKILLADEPTGNLDSKNAQLIFETLAGLNKNGLTIIVVTHNLELAKLARRIVLLEDGMIKQLFGGQYQEV